MYICKQTAKEFSSKAEYDSWTANGCKEVAKKEIKKAPVKKATVKPKEDATESKGE